MIDFTKFFKFKKPDGDEFYDVALNNENLDSIDNLLSTHIHDGRYYTEAEVNTHLSNKAPLASPNFIGIPKIAGKEIPTTETGTWTPNIIVANNIITTTHKAVGKWIKVGIEWLITLDTSITFSKATAPQYTIDGLPIVFPSGTPVNIADAFNGASAHGNYGFIADGKIRVFPGENATLVQNKSTLYISIKGYGI